ncbi:MAG: hypothetical protein H6718_00035, partial [Polyangiaceae bacterium]|nr:hypothetical protein [Polyangiaceae bacterium]
MSLLAIGLAPRGAVASPDRIAVTDVYAEPGLGDDAGAVTLLVRAALDRPERAVVPLAELATAAGSDGERVVVDLDRIPEVATALGARWVVVGELVRDGAGVRAALIVLDRAGDVTARVEARAPDGALVELVTPLVEGIAQATGGLPANRTATVSVGQLRRFVRAIRAWRGHRDADAAAALDGADPTVALKVPATEEVAHALWQDPSLGADARLIAVLAAGTPRDVVELATGSSGRDRAARAMARMALSDAGAAEKELAGVPRGDARDPRVLRARAALAAMRRDASGRDAL